MELDEPAHTLSPHTFHLQSLRSADTEAEAHERPTYYLAAAPRVFDSPVFNIYSSHGNCTLHYAVLPRMCDDTMAPMVSSWSDSEDENKEELHHLKSFFNSPTASPSMKRKCNIVQREPPMRDWSNEEEEDLEFVEESGRLLKQWAGLGGGVFTC